jgi:GTPase Era involved in 16S rRNA processing
VEREFGTTKAADRSLREFSSRKAFMLHCMSDLQAIANDLNCDANVDFLRSMKSKLSEEGFNIVVLGGFKRGKSTLINAMVGSGILPTGVVPLTSVITKLRYGTKTEAEIAFNDGKRMIVDVTSLNQYVTEKGNPGNTKNVAEVDLHVNSSLLGNGAVIVDTPGVGSSYERNTLVTYDFLAQVDAALFVFGVDPPISQMELEFLDDIKGNSNVIFLIQNKIDMLDKRESEEALNFSRSVLIESLKDPDLRVFPISAKLALEAKEDGDDEKLIRSRYVELEREVMNFLATGKGQAILANARMRLVKIASDLFTAVGIEHGILCRPVREMNEKIDWLQREIQTARRRLDEMDSLVDSRVSRIINQLTQRLEEIKNSARLTLVPSLDAFLQSMPETSGRREYLEAIQRFITEEIENNYSSFVKSASAEISKGLRLAVVDFSTEADRSSEDLMKRVADVFGVTMRAPDVPEIDVEESRFYFDQVSVLKCESIVPAELPMILPNRLYRRNIARKARQVMLDEIEKQGGRIRYDIDYRLSESSRRLKSEVRSRMLSSVESLESALSMGLRSRTEASRERESRLVHLEKIERRLKTVSVRLAAA